MFILQILGAILILSFLIFIHELGHFLAAKKNGVKVHEFALGFPPTLFKKKKGDTEYKLNLIPFGGYVKLHGEDSFDKKVLKDKDSFASKTPWQKIQILMAGVVMNFLVFWVLSTGALMFGSEPFILNTDDLKHAFEEGYVDYEYGFVAEEQVMEQVEEAYNNLDSESLMSFVEDGSLDIFTELPAWEIGGVDSFWDEYLQDGDLLLSVGGVPLFDRETFVNRIVSSEEVEFVVLRDGDLERFDVVFPYDYEVDNILPESVAMQAGVMSGDRLLSVDGVDVNRGQTVLDISRESSGDEIEYVFVRDGEELRINMTPGEDGVVGMSLLPSYGAAVIGFGYVDSYYPFTINDFDYDIALWEAPFVSLQNGWEISKLTAVGFVTTLGDVIFRFDVSDEVGGPVQVAKLSYEFVGLGGTELMNFIALISLSLAVINILPIPALDGGRILFVIIEALRGKVLNRKIEAYIHAIGFFALMVFILVVTVFDLLRL